MALKQQIISTMGWVVGLLFAAILLLISVGLSTDKSYLAALLVFVASVLCLPWTWRVSWLSPASPIVRIMAVIVVTVISITCIEIKPKSNVVTKAVLPAPNAVASIRKPETTTPTTVQSKECQITTCSAGSVVITGPKKDGPYFACQSEELGEYTNFIIGLISLQRSLGVAPNNVDPETGEPQYEGETEAILSRLRAAAGVRTFDQALTMCKYGAYRRKVQVMNYEKGRDETWVMDLHTNSSYWLPTSEIALP